MRRLVAETHTRSWGKVPVTLDSSLEKDLGLDSLGRMELLMRVERAFAVPEQTPHETVQVDGLCHYTSLLA